MSPTKKPAPARTAAAGKPPAARKPAAPGARARRRAPNPAKRWASYLRRYRPGLVPYVLDALEERYGPQAWERRLDPVSELVLTILTQNTADTNAEKAYEALRRAYPSTRPPEAHHPGIGWGGDGLPTAPPPDWSLVENAPLPELVDVIRPGGLAPQKAPRIQATLQRIREERGAYDLEFLADLPVLEARDWLTSIDGIGRKTASIVLAFCFGMPAMAVDRHVERVSKRIGLIPAKATADQAHDLYLELVEPERMYAAHVLLIHHGRAICHAQNPAHDICPVRDRCRMVNPRAV
jgi:endonuclease III